MPWQTGFGTTCRSILLGRRQPERLQLASCTRADRLRPVTVLPDKIHRQNRSLHRDQRGETGNMTGNRTMEKGLGHSRCQPTGTLLGGPAGKAGGAAARIGSDDGGGRKGKRHHAARHMHSSAKQ